LISRTTTRRAPDLISKLPPRRRRRSLLFSFHPPQLTYPIACTPCSSIPLPQPDSPLPNFSTHPIHQNDWRQIWRQGQRQQVQRPIVSPLSNALIDACPFVLDPHLGSRFASLGRVFSFTIFWSNSSLVVLPRPVSLSPSVVFTVF
jgi:hypothetical protein